MGHDYHFLSRLNRVEGASLDLALGLYRDTERVKWLMDFLPLGSAEVVALPLVAGEAPPYALVSRKGKFITCLGAGMVPDAAVVTWPQFDRVTGQLQAWRELKAKGQDRARTVERRMFLAGPWMAREDFEDLQVVASLYPNAFAELLPTLVKPFLELRVRFRPRDFDPLTPRTKEIISKAWKSAWATSHASLVVTEAYLAQQVLVPDLPYSALVAQATLPALLGLDGTLVRAGWTLGRLGPPAIDRLAAALYEGLVQDVPGSLIEPGTEDGSFFTRVARIYALLAIAGRVPEERARIREILLGLAPAEALAMAAGRAPDAVPGPLHAAKYNFFTVAVATAISHLDEAEQGFPTSLEALAEVAKGFWTGETQPDRLVQGPAPRPSREAPTPSGRTVTTAELAAQVPPDMMFVPAFGLYSDLYTHGQLLIRRLHLMPRLAAKTPPDLFFARTRLDYLAKEFVISTPVEHVRDLLKAQYKGAESRQPVRAVAAPGRNEACGCGSGIKYKKCCGA